MLHKNHTDVIFELANVFDYILTYIFVDMGKKSQVKGPENAIFTFYIISFELESRKSIYMHPKLLPN